MKREKTEPAPTFPLKYKQKRKERNYDLDPLPVLKFLPLTKTESIQKGSPFTKTERRKSANFKKLSLPFQNKKYTKDRNW